MTLEVYHTLFIVFLVITIILFVLLIVFFFIFDIWKIISIKTGWAVKQSVKELYKINQKEDNAKRKKYKANSVSFKKEDKEAPVTVKLEQEENGTVPLEVLTDFQEIPGINDVEEKKRKKEEFFDIVETRIVMFSDEIITKKQVRAKM